jgi:lysozyme
MAQMTPSSAAVDIVRRFEGFRSNAYADPGSGGEPWTIGYGTTVYPDGSKVCKGDQCTQEAATQWLYYELNAKAVAISAMIKVPLQQCQFDALCSFAYNVGTAAFDHSTMRELINAGMFKDAADQFPRWTLASGKVLPGLMERREAERALFLGEQNA